jgi:hypothetical protein
MASLCKLLIIPMEPNPDPAESLLKCGNSILFAIDSYVHKISELRTKAHRLALLLKQHSSITVMVCRQRKTNFRFFLFPFAATNGSLPFLISVCSKQTVVVFR